MGTFNYSEILKIFSQILTWLRNGFVKDTTDNDSIFNENENLGLQHVCGIPQGFTGQGPVVGYT